MATPSVTANLTIINSCDTIAGWSGDSFLPEPDVKKQGANCISCASTSNGTNRITCSVSNVALGSEHIRLWFNSTITSFYASTTGLQLEVTHQGGTAVWNVDPNNNYAGGWLNIVIYGGSTPDSGTPIGSNLCSSISIVQNTVSKPRTAINTYVDYVRYGDGLTVTGGTSNDKITLKDIAAVDNINGYGIAENIDGVIFLSGELQIGNGTTATWFEDLGDVLVFTDKTVSPSLYKLSFSGSGCNAAIASGLYKAAGTQSFVFDSTLASTFTMVGKQVVNADTTNLAAGQTIKGCIFDACKQVNPASSTFTGNSLTNSTDPNGALLLPSTNNVDNIVFDNNTYDVYITTPTTYSDISFTHNTNTSDLHYNNLGNGTFNVPSNGNTSTVTNSSSGVLTVVTGQTNFKFTVSPSITNYEYRLYEDNHVSGQLGVTELLGAENAASDNATYTYTYSSDQDVALQIIANDYEEYIGYYTLGNLDQNVVITLTPEENT